MKQILGIIMTMSCLILSAGVGLADDPMSNKEASPTLKERITKDAVKGELLNATGEHYVIREDGGKEVRVHVDSSTKMDKVMKGDRVKAYVTEKGHATTLQRLEK
jgi:hypothetical protein